MVRKIRKKGMGFRFGKRGKEINCRNKKKGSIERSQESQVRRVCNAHSEYSFSYDNCNFVNFTEYNNCNIFELKG